MLSCNSSHPGSGITCGGSEAAPGAPRARRVCGPPRGLRSDRPRQRVPDVLSGLDRAGAGPLLDVVCNPALGLPNPALPLSFPDNFPVEVFYSRAIAKMT